MLLLLHPVAIVADLTGLLHLSQGVYLNCMRGYRFRTTIALQKN
jgi:hypothetical protein